MSVLIKGMEMPKYCYTYPAYDYIKSFCCVLRTKVINLNDNRYKDCPLIAVPTHGRLIDADELLKVIEENSYRLRGVINSTENGMFLSGIRQAIDEAPTIIEAEVSE